MLGRIGGCSPKADEMGEFKQHTTKRRHRIGNIGVTVAALPPRVHPGYLVQPFAPHQIGQLHGRCIPSSSDKVGYGFMFS